MKKILSAILALTMIATMSACNSDNGAEETTTAATTTAATTTAATTTAATTTEATTEAVTEAAVPEVVAEAAPEALYTYAFDGDLGAASIVVREGDNEDGGNAGTLPIAGEAEVTYADGKSGQAVYLNGSYGLNLNAAPIGDTYSVAFWMSADRFAEFAGPIIQTGSDLLSANAKSTWMNVTRTTWGVDGAPISPVVWSRNEEVNVWPWFADPNGSLLEKKTWYHIVVTVDGTQAGFEDGAVFGAVYVDGVQMNVGSVAPKTFGQEDSQMYLGINCWDIIFKGYFDDVKLYDTALTYGQVKGLYESY